MIRFKHLIAFTLILVLFCPSSLAAKKKNEEYTAREITTEVVQDIPAEIQQVLDLAYQQWQKLTRPI